MSERHTPLQGVPILVGARGRTRVSDEPTSSPPTGPENERLAVVERDVTEINRRLGEGAQSFDELRKAFNDAASATAGAFERLTESTRPKQREIPWLAIAGLAISILGPVGLLIWNAAHYPERGEFNDLRDKVGKLDTADQLRTRDVKEITDTLRRIEDTVARAAAAPIPPARSKP